MKVISAIALMSVSSAIIVTHPMDALLDGSLVTNDGDKVTKPSGQEWNSYVQARGEHDCAIKEIRNWFGSARCIQSFECQGARLCEGGSKELGWCSGDSNCPNLGPLDFHD